MITVYSELVKSVRSFRRRRDEMFLEIARPVRREPTRTTASAELQRAFQMPQFDPESGECRKCVDDQSTVVTGDVIALVGIRYDLRGTDLWPVAGGNYRSSAPPPVHLTGVPIFLPLWRDS